MSHRVHTIRVGTADELAAAFFGINDLAVNTDTGALQLSTGVGLGNSTLLGGLNNSTKAFRELELPIANNTNGLVGVTQVPAGEGNEGGFYSVITNCFVRNTTTGAPVAVLQFRYLISVDIDTGEAILECVIVSGDTFSRDIYFTSAGSFVAGNIEVLPTGETAVDINNASGSSVTIETFTTVTTMHSPVH